MRKAKFKIIMISSASSSFFLSSGKGNIKDILIDNWFAQVAFQLKKFCPGLEIECWTPEKNYRKEKALKHKVIKFRAFPSKGIRHGMEISLSMIKALKEEQKKADRQNKKIIVHIHEHHSWISYSILLFTNKKITKVICQHHGGRSPIANLKRYKRLILFLPVFALMQFFENLLFKKVDVFYALSDEEIGYLKKIAPKSEVKFQTMGIPEEYFQKGNREKARKKLGLDSKKKYILYIGRIKATKGIKKLLDAMKQVEAELLLIGGGEDFERYKKYAEERKIENVKFLGPIYNKEKLAYLDASNCLVLPSYTEGAPVVLMEAIAKNLPVIATNVGGIGKMIKQGREGFLIPVKAGEKIKNAIREVLFWNKDIRKYGEKYRWEKIIKETLIDYKKLFKNNR